MRSQIHVRSTDIDRTLMSAEANLAGLYPPSGSQVWNEKLLWQPIPVHTVPDELEYVSDVQLMLHHCSDAGALLRNSFWSLRVFSVCS